MNKFNKKADINYNKYRKDKDMKKIFILFLTVFLALALISAVSAEGSEISYGKSYTLVTPASAAYPDDGIKLTDGIFGTIPDGGSGYYSSGAYVGFNQVDTDDNGNFEIILDLGQLREDISAITVGFLNETSVGIYAPKSVSFALADDRNGSYTELGTLDTEKSTEGGLSETFAMTLAAEDASGRYLRVLIEHLGEFADESGETKTAGWTFIDEISVYSSGNASNGTGDESLNESSNTVDESSNTVDESSSPIESSEISENETSTPLTESSTPEIPEAGDNGGILAFILLAISSFAMIGALFTSRKISNRI